VDVVQRAFTIDECCLEPASTVETTQPPASPVLLGTSPNPVVSLANIIFGLPEGGGSVRLRIYDVQGRALREIQAPRLTAGYHRITWDARDESGREVPPGVYFYSISMGDWSATRKLQLLR
jgi:flagellar hook assembly protein FlgD